MPPLAEVPRPEGAAVEEEEHEVENSDDEGEGDMNNSMTDKRQHKEYSDEEDENDHRIQRIRRASIMESLGFMKNLDDQNIVLQILDWAGGKIHLEHRKV